jgi:autotransporter-associated beta strand protein
VKTGNGLLTLSGTNSYSGGTTINGGTLQVGDGNFDGSLAPGTVSVNTNSVLSFYPADTLTVSNAITGGGTVALVGGGTIIFTGSNTYSGGTTINAGNLQIGSGGTLGSPGSGPVTNNDVLSFNRSDVYTVPAAINGSGALVQLGPGTLVLNTGDSYTGQTWIAGGAMRANSGAGLPSSSNLVLDGGVLESNGSASFTWSIGSGSSDVQWTSAGGGFSANGGTLTVNLGGSDGTINWGTSASQIRGTLMFGSATANNETDFVNPVNLKGVNRTIQVTAGLGGDFAEMSGVLSNSTGTAGLIKTGNGLLVLTGSNTYNGTTTISGGTLQVDAGGATGTLGTGSVVDNSALVFSRSDSYTLANAISGSGSVSQNGSGWLGLSGTNTYTGSTTVSSGTLQVLGPAALPDGGLVVAAGGTVIFGSVIFGSNLEFSSPAIAETLATLAPSDSDMSGDGTAISALSALNSPAVAPAASQPGANSVPEPDALLLLLAAGGSGLLWHVRRRRNSGEPPSDGIHQDPDVHDGNSRRAVVCRRIFVAGQVLQIHTLHCRWPPISVMRICGRGPAARS